MAIKIAGTTVIDDSEQATFAALTVDGASQLNGSVVINDSGLDADFRVEGNTDANLILADAGNDRVTIGTAATGAQKLNVGGNMEIDGDIISSTNFYLYSDSGGVGVRSGINLDGPNQTLYLMTGSLNRVTLTSTGDVGIGTSSPSGVLDVQDNEGSLGATRDITAEFWRQDGTYIPRLQIRHSTAGSDINHSYTTGASNLTFSNGGAEGMRLDGSGNLMVGGSVNYGFRLQSETSAAQGAALFARYTALPLVNLVTVTSNVGGSGSTRLVILANGNVQNVNNSYGAYSDAKLKENIIDATPKLEKLDQVRVVNYNLKNEPEIKLLGVVAQELEQIFPSMVDDTPDLDKYGNDLGTTTKSVKYSVFVPMLIKAIQELKARVEQLESTE